MLAVATRSADTLISVSDSFPTIFLIPAGPASVGSVKSSIEEAGFKNIESSELELALALEELVEGGVIVLVLEVGLLSGISVGGAVEVGEGNWLLLRSTCGKLVYEPCFERGMYISPFGKV
ncbi:hypothetical protein WICPIJ_008735 [Wickerhamomyces pijperi]|uniref:Uncharacterized protein n=1 Tax=Wickerhamomyces pijperi TaxID=599730 RepID=A0A9P8PVE1_WICPI|nr:hypothetical protein WICPIJ_008735 [Wickerhamomyces pijperi]